MAAEHGREWRSRMFEAYWVLTMAYLGLSLPFLVLVVGGLLRGRFGSVSFTLLVRQGIFLLPIVLLSLDSARRMMLLKGQQLRPLVVAAVVICVVSAVVCLAAAVGLSAGKLTAHGTVVTYVTVIALGLSYAVCSVSVLLGMLGSFDGSRSARDGGAEASPGQLAAED